MGRWDRCNKISGIYWPKDKIEHMIFNIKLKTVDGLITLPRFEDYINATNECKLQDLQTKTEQLSFKWQQKTLSEWEIHQYSKKKNCKTEIHMKYYDMIKNRVQCQNKVFTYINDDKCCPNKMLKEDDSYMNDEVTRLDIDLIETCFKCLKLENKSTLDESPESNSKRFGSQNNWIKRDDLRKMWTSMHVMMDLSNKEEDIEVVQRRETVLLSIYYNHSTGCLLLCPGENNMLWNPYSIKDCPELQYEVKISKESSEVKEIETSRELVKFLHTLKNKWERRHFSLLDFDCPGPHERRVYFTVEILSAANFENSQLFIEYEVHSGGGADSKLLVEGCTHVAAVRRDVANYSNAFHFHYEQNVSCQESSASDPTLYIEVISRDWWHRERSEGVGYLRLSRQAGVCTVAVQCVRIAESSVEAMSKRFFLGGARLLQDRSWISVPDGHQCPVLNKFGAMSVTSGTVWLRTAVVMQHGAVGRAPRRGASALLRSVDAVLQDYRHARDRLHACRADFGTGTPNSSADPSNSSAGPSNLSAGQSNSSSGPSNLSAGQTNSSSGPSDSPSPSKSSASPSSSNVGLS